MESMKGVTSVKVHHAPGGKTSISLFGGYGDDEDKNKKKTTGAVGQAQEEEKKEEVKEEASPAGGSAALKQDAVKGAVDPNATANAAGGKAAVDANPHAIGAGVVTSVKYSGQPPGGKSSGPLW